MVWVPLMYSRMLAFAADFVLVPVVGLEDLLDHAGLGLGEHTAATDSSYSAPHQLLPISAWYPITSWWLGMRLVRI